MLYMIKDREDNLDYDKEGKLVNFLYGNVIGRFIIKFLSLPFISKLIGLFLSSRFSKLFIKPFIKKNNIDMSIYEDVKYKSFNSFFIRKKKQIDFIKDKNVFISPCDAKLTIYDVNEYSCFEIKNSFYSVRDLLNEDEIYKDYIDGKALVFRLCKDDYHRYHYVDDGSQGNNYFVKGVLNTVRPIAYRKCKVFKRNSREYTTLHTKNFGDIVEVEVGATLVGKIKNKHDNYEFKKGEEKGMFLFGGSTIVLLIKKDVIDIDKDILNNSVRNIETRVKCGEKIGVKKR